MSLDEIESSILKWCGHVMGIGDDRLPKQYANWVSEGSRPGGRPRKICMDELKTRSRILEEMEGLKLYEDRREWRVFWKSSTWQTYCKSTRWIGEKWEVKMPEDIAFEA